MKKSTEITDYKKLTKYIRYPESGSIVNWRPTASPYLYVSFDLDQLLETWGETAFAQSVLNQYGAGQFPKPVLDELKKLLQEEWIDKAQLPVKFLDKNAKGAEIFCKNVCFIVSMDFPEDELRKRVGNAFMDTTSSALDIDGAGVSQSYYKIIRVPKLQKIQDMNNWLRQAFLHEIGHALCELKHFKHYNEDDKKPYSKIMTCEHSVMSYHDTCPRVLKKYQETNNIVLANMEFPVVLGPVDLAAAAEFREAFIKRHENHQKRVKKLGYDPLLTPQLREHISKNKIELTVEPTESSLDLVLQYFGLGQAAKYLEQEAGKLARSLVQDCPNYFNATLPAPLDYKNNMMLMFQPSAPVALPSGHASLNLTSS